MSAEIPGGEREDEELTELTIPLSFYDYDTGGREDPFEDDGGIPEGHIVNQGDFEKE